MLILRQNSPSFTIEIGGEVSIVAKRLESWQWARAEAASVAAARALKDGAVVLETYGFDGEEFAALADPANWKGVAEYLYAVEVGHMAIESWNGVIADHDPPFEAEVSRSAICKLMRIDPVRRCFMARMNEESGNFLEEVPEGGRLYELGKWEFGEGGEHCTGCAKLDRPCSKGLPGEDGALCPRHENEPRTAEGRAAAAIAGVAGVWNYAGMAGALVGLNWPACRLQMPVHGIGLEWRRVAALLHYYARGAVEGAASRKKSDSKPELG